MLRAQPGAGQWVAGRLRLDLPVCRGISELHTGTSRWEDKVQPLQHSLKIWLVKWRRMSCCEGGCQENAL